MAEYWQNGLFEQLPQCIAIFCLQEKTLRLQAMNQRMCNLLGVAPRKQWEDTQVFLVYPEDRKKLQSWLVAALKCGQSEEAIQIRLKQHETADYIWCEGKVSCEDAEDGQRYCYLVLQDITEQRQKEQRLQQNIEGMRAAMDHCGVYYAFYHVQENMTTYSPRIQEDFGFPERVRHGIEQPMGLLTEQGRLQLHHIAEEMKEGRMVSAVLEMEVRRPKKGDWIWTQQGYTIFEKDANGKPIMVLSTVRNISKEKEEEKWVSEENMYHQMVFGNMTSVIRMDISKWKVLDFTGEYVLKYKEQESPFATIAQHILLPEQKKEFLEIFSRESLLKSYENEQRSVSYTYWCHRISGKRLWMKAVVDMTGRDDKGVFGLISIQDVDRQVVGREVQGQVANTLVDFSAYYNVDARDGEVFAKNPEFEVEGVYGKDALRALQRKIMPTIIPEEYALHRDQLGWDCIYEKLSRGERWDFVYHVKDQTGKVRTKRLNAFMQTECGNVVIVMQRDITEIIEEQEAQNAELQSALSIANQASHARDEFLSSMSHDLRTPLNGMIGAAELLREEAGQWTKQAQEYLKDIVSSGRFMQNLINNIIDSNRMSQGKITLNLDKYTIQDLITDMKLMFGASCEEKGIHLVLDPGEQMRMVYADRVCLQRIFSNLLSNAIKFTPTGGTITLQAVEREMLGGKYLVTVVVKDTGTGMSREFQEHMFDVFTQEDNDVNVTQIGSGLGLSIAKNLVELMEGSIRCDSVQGEGTQFTVVLPLKLVDTTPKQQPYQASEEEPLREELLWDRRVLLAEDNDLNAKIVMRLLESKQINVERVADGQQLVKKYEEMAPYTYDAILMDIQMPVMDGPEASKQVRRLQREDAGLIPIVALTANAFDVDVQKSKSAGMNGHLIKPIEPKKLFRILAKLWEIGKE